MKKILLALATAITATATGTSLYLSTLENPTNLHRGLSTTANTIIVAGTFAIFGLLDDRSSKGDEDVE